MPALYATAREDGSITVIDLSGRIALGEGSALLRTTIRDLLDWRIGERIHGRAQPPRRAETVASDKESARSSANHEAVHGV
jgi:hypothetical protein